MGEARAKCDHNRFVALMQDTARQLHMLYLAKGINATTAIEGNTLTQAQVLERIEGQLELPISKEYLGTEIDNMLDAYNNGPVRRIHGRESVPLNPETLKLFNTQVLHNLEAEDHVVPGQFRICSVAAGPYLAPPFQEVEHLVEKLCTWINSVEPPNEQLRIPDAFIKAVVAHVYIEWIHPYGDGNG